MCFAYRASVALQLLGRRMHASAVQRSTVVLVAEKKLVANMVTHSESNHSSALIHCNRL